jgi:hypothetical protein
VTAWKLPFVVAAIAVPITVAFLTVGPALGLAVGALVAVSIVAFAVRQRPHDAIAPAGADSHSRRVLLVVNDPLEEPAAVSQVASLVGDDEKTSVRVLSPAHIDFLDRWASDVEPARHDAQQRLVISVASLAAAGIKAEARVGDRTSCRRSKTNSAAFRPPK